MLIALENADPKLYHLQALSAKEALAEQLNLDKQTAELALEQLEDRVRDGERSVHSLTVERDLLVGKVGNLKETVKKLEEQVTTSSTHLYTAKAGTVTYYVGTVTYYT